jgi:tagatose-1,6-bisphosphate aldolase
MAEISARIKPKKSSTTAEVPSASDLEVAEIAVNTADGKLFVKHTDNSVKTIGGNISGIDDLTDVDTSTVAPTDGQALLWDNANSQWEPGDVVGNTDLTYTASTRLLESSTGTDVTLPEVVAAGDSGLMTGADKTKLDGIDAGAQVNVATDLSNTPAASTVDVESSTGTNTTLPAATTTLAGVMTGADKTKLDGIDAGAEVNVGTDLTYTASTRVLASSTGTDATLPEVVASGDSGLMTGADKAKLDGITAGAEPNVDTDLTYTASTRLLESSTGTDVTLPEVVASGNSGLITGADKAKLDGISPGAEVNAVDSVAGKTGVVTLVKADITDFSDADYATAAQGTTADSAVQPTDSIDVLSDVDTTTVAPTDGQALIWDNANSQWEPGDVGYWSRNGTTLSTATAGDSVDIGSGAILTTVTDGDIDLDANGAGLIKVTEYNLAQLPIVTQNDIGTAANEVPLNGMLGGMAFQDPASVSVDNLEVTNQITGNLAFADGNGINFGATTGSGSTSELLDDYEEGTFTPQLWVGSTQQTLDVSYGTYRKIGSLVFVKCHISASSVSGSGALEIRNLPFSQASGGLNQTALAVQWSGTLNEYSVYSNVYNSTRVQLIYSIAGGNTTSLQETDIAANSAFGVAGCYEVS